MDEWRGKSAEGGYVSLEASAILFRGIAYCWRRRPSSGAVCALTIALVNFSRAADKQGGLCHIRSSVNHVQRLFTAPSFVESIVKDQPPSGSLLRYYTVCNRRRDANDLSRSRI
jgi:hypothetical protein